MVRKPRFWSASAVLGPTPFISSKPADKIIRLIIACEDMRIMTERGVDEIRATL